MKYGLSESQLHEIIAFISQYPEVEEAVLFGSRAIDTFKEASDIDIALKGEFVNHGLAAKLKYNIEEDTYLPFFFDFVAYPTITNEDLKKHIDTKGVVIYRKGEVGMSEWKECLLKEIADVQTGPFGSQLKNEQYITGGTPVVTVEHIQNFRISEFDYPSVTAEDKNRLSRYLLTTGDIVFTRVGSVDLNAWVKPTQNGWMFSSRMLRVRPVSEVDSRFLSYYFQQKSFRDHILNISVGATMPSINTEILEGVQVAFPPLPEQRAIATVLSSLDDKIDLLHRQNKTLEAMAETLFRQWFVEEADEGWEETNLYNCADFINGAAFKDADFSKTSQGLPVVKIAEIKAGVSEQTRYSTKNLDDKYIIHNEEILFSWSGTPETSLGIFVWMGGDGLLNQHIFRIKPKKLKGKSWIFFLLRYSMPEFVRFATHKQTIGLGHVTVADLKTMIVKLPPEEVLEEHSKLLDPIFSKIVCNLASIRNITSLRDTLLPKLMSGEVRVEV